MRAKGLLTSAAIALLQGSALTASAQMALPGTPDVGFKNPGGATVVFGEGSFDGYVPEPITTTDNATPYFTFAGDIVFLNDPNAGHDPSNWLAVLRFFNPADPTGTLSLEANLVETLVPENTPQGFANLSLLPNVAYAPVPQDGRSDNYYGLVLTEFGPVGAIAPGQLAIIAFEAARKPVIVPEPSTIALLAFALAASAAGLLRERRPRAVAQH